MRKGVPYPSEAICSLKERIAELEQRMASLVNTINHIAANSGDISIGADKPLNVTNDATAHKITVGVSKDNTPIKDSSALVTSGGVYAAIDAGDAEAVKLTGDQSIAGVKSFSSNPKIAAPASGATDNSAVNANWVSQTGNGAPNNLIHRTGNEDISGMKRHISGVLGQSYQLTLPGSGNYSIEIAYKGINTQFAKIEIFDYINHIDSVMWDIFLVWNGGGQTSRAYGRRLGDPNTPIPKFTIDNGILKVIFTGKIYHSYLVNVTAARSWNNNQEVTVTMVQDPDYSGLTLTDVVIQ